MDIILENSLIDLRIKLDNPGLIYKEGQLLKILFDEVKILFISIKEKSEYLLVDDTISHLTGIDCDNFVCYLKPNDGFSSYQYHLNKFIDFFNSKIGTIHVYKILYSSFSTVCVDNVKIVDFELSKQCNENIRDVYIINFNTIVRETNDNHKAESQIESLYDIPKLNISTAVNKNLSKQKVNEIILNKWRGDVYRCFCCDKKIDKSLMELEFGHVIPKSKGGKYTTDNIRPVCIPCNRGPYNKGIGGMRDMHMYKYMIINNMKGLKNLTEEEKNINLYNDH